MGHEPPGQRSTWYFCFCLLRQATRLSTLMDVLLRNDRYYLPRGAIDGSISRRSCALTLFVWSGWPGTGVGSWEERADDESIMDWFVEQVASYDPGTRSGASAPLKVPASFVRWPLRSS